MGEDRNALTYRLEFPGLGQCVYGKPLVYLDNAATNQVSAQVIEAIATHLQKKNANTHRGIHHLSELATKGLEDGRSAAARFIHASRPENIVFNSGATAGFNTIALGLEPHIKPTDAVLVTRMEHHSNFVPWQQLCRRTGAEFRVTPLTQTGALDTAAFRAHLADGRVKIATFTHVSNVTGAVNPVKQLILEAKDAGALTALDAAQAARSGFLDVQALACDFCCFSAHKMIGPTGVGVLYGSDAALEKLETRSFGGGMVDHVRMLDTEVSEIPFRFEAGTPNIAGIAGFKAAIEDIERFDPSWISGYEKRLLDHVGNRLRSIEEVEVLGNLDGRYGAISFGVKNRHPYDLASVMDKQGVAIRVGHHCAIPHLAHYGQSAVMRISPAFYNTFAEMDACIEALEKAIAFFEKWSD